MELEKQVVSPDLAKRLKELGVPQESFFYWITSSFETDSAKTLHLAASESLELLVVSPGLRSQFDTGKDWVYLDSGNEGEYWKVLERYAAFTVAELGEMLPLYLKADADRGIAFTVETDSLNIRKTYENKKWVIEYRARHAVDEKEADARAKMLIYLLENQLLDISQRL